MKRIPALALALTLLTTACGAGISTEAGVIDDPVPAATEVTPDDGALAVDDPAPPETRTAAGSAEPATSPVADADEPTAPAEPVSTDSRLVASAAGDLTVYDAVDGSAATTLPAATEFGSTTTLLVLERIDGWLHVALPIEPNGQTGWIPESAVSLARVNHRVVVSLADRTLTVFDGEDTLLSTNVAIGSTENPTPTGSNLFVTDVLRTGSETSPYGPFALGLSLHSETLSEFGGGDGQIGIHGTDDPSSIGQAVSHGCVRVSNAVVTELAGLLPLGTPVVIS